ncbi:helix-turn-helix domain-containing protein [Francisella noatunensis]|uniref:Helix-turn-helix domain-containing protein n=2 Tax=Francisella noatunensis TaxID=657445 RepID=A0A9Q2KZK1_9GAMM|nr:YerC/YecD family TrpR-related protein [Francisella noatunensis]MBK2028714.1 helix-turn-helix domain-containing protein [Francisella noatunensis]MBK2033529.1 helix-turn-helix domain-containing protein [Francisella noatunensis]MBK2049015.1 helix-turn-helix domain-containing protein [Francisella noatunensis]MBK2049891.1 helix-turn-helix domain-containing protein [Francisella noatunensis]MBK2051898.1 helix-turn-helix domain-containing protein [Francisella noatunensis]
MKFLKALSLLKRPSFFLEDLCTPVDLMAMAARWRVVKELKKDKPYRQIHAETGVSLTTISRVARCLSYGTNGYNTIYNKINKES